MAKAMIEMGGVINEIEFVVEEDYPWDAAAARKRVFEKLNWDGYKKMHLYKDPNTDPEIKEGYKLAVMDIVNGRLQYIWGAVKAAMQAILGARGGPDIPREDKKKIYGKLVKLYDLWDKEPPEFHFTSNAGVPEFFCGNCGKKVTLFVIPVEDRFVAPVGKCLNCNVLFSFRNVLVEFPQLPEAPQSASELLEDIYQDARERNLSKKEASKLAMGVMKKFYRKPDGKWTKRLKPLR